MRKNFIFSAVLLLTASAGLTNCSSSETSELQTGVIDEAVNSIDLAPELLVQKPLWTSKDFGYLNTSSYKTEDGSAWLWHDNFGRLTTIMLFIPATMDISVLYQNPSSVNQLNGKYYQLGNDNELKLYDSFEFEGQHNDFNTSDMAYGFEHYRQYFKGVKVFGAGYSVNYYITPQGKRLAYANGQLLTELSVDTNPLITANQAKRIFAARLGEQATKNWTAELMVREFIIKENDDDVRDERLVWHVKGSEYPEEEAWKIVALSSSMVSDDPLCHEAQIDAHTGQLLIEGNTLSFATGY